MSVSALTALTKSRLRDAEEDYRARKEGERKLQPRAGRKSKSLAATFLPTWDSPTPRTCCPNSPSSSSSVEPREVMQSAAAKLIGISQGDFSKVLRGQFRVIPRPMRMLTAFGQKAEITTRPHQKRPISDGCPKPVL